MGKKFFVLYLLSCILFSCAPDEIFFEYHSLNENGWNKEEAAVFQLNIDDSTMVYDTYLAIRNNNDYPFSNLWLFVDINAPDGSIRTDTVNIDLADVYGKWYGKGLSLYNLTVPYEKSFRFPKKGLYRYVIRQGMRENSLKGISDIGLKISKKLD
jgi:gliding motility-associated lipoprotein GldH